ncbi:MAG: metallophosphoesterase [Lachnospiraceae bacterium]|nr:metallophosphoesterase [Lachnospiraceae bacterium]
MRYVYIICICILLIILYVIYEYFQLECRKFVHYDLDRGLGIKAVVITDLHNKLLSAKDLEKIRREQPDCILFAGDLLVWDEPDISKALTSVKALAEIADVYFSYGNHELRFKDEHKEEWEELLKKLPSNFYALDNDHRSLNDKVEVYGISLKRENYKKGRVFDMGDENADVFKNMPEGRFNILLAHNPDLTEYYDRVMHADLTVSGHLHGGVVRLPLFGGLVFSTYGIKHRDRGLYEGRHVVSSGAGEHLFPSRIFNRCEIVIIQL